MNDQQTLQRPPAVPIEYAGRWIAWNRQRTKIVATGATLPEARQAAQAAGETAAVFAKAPRANVRFVGGRA